MSNEIVQMPMQDMQLAAEAFASSGLFPQWGTPDKVLSLLMICQSEGRNPLSAMQRYDNVKGKLTKKPHAMLADFNDCGGRLEWLESTNEVAKAQFTTPNGVVHVEEFTMEDAARAKLATKDNWRNYPKAMLRARCLSAGFRAVWPSSTGLMYVPEEIESIPQRDKPKPIEVTATTVEPEKDDKLFTPDSFDAVDDEHEKQRQETERLREVDRLGERIAEHKIGNDTIKAWLDHFEVDDIDKFDAAALKFIHNGIDKNYGEQ